MKKIITYIKNMILRPKIIVRKHSNVVDEVIFTIWNIPLVHIERMDENYWWAEFWCNKYNYFVDFTSKKKINVWVEKV